jgi:hypothetical protein
MCRLPRPPSAGQVAARCAAPRSRPSRLCLVLHPRGRPRAGALVPRRCTIWAVRVLGARWRCQRAQCPRDGGTACQILHTSEYKRMVGIKPDLLRFEPGWRPSLASPVAEQGGEGRHRHTSPPSAPPTRSPALVGTFQRAGGGIKWGALRPPPVAELGGGPTCRAWGRLRRPHERNRRGAPPVDGPLAALPRAGGPPLRLCV